MSRYNNTAIIIIGLCLIVLAGCKSDQPVTPASPQSDTASSNTTGAPVATDNTAAASPIIEPVAVPPAQQKASVAANDKFVGMVVPKHEVPVAQPIIESGAQSNASSALSSQDPVEVRNLESQFVMNGRGWYVLGEIKNSSGKLLRKVELTTSLLDDKGKSVAEQTDDLPPALVPSQAGERKQFSISVKPPSGWQGKAAVKVTHVEF